MEALMLKLSDNIRQKEIQCKQLQDTVQFGCEERKELQEQISQLQEMYNDLKDEVNAIKAAVPPPPVVEGTSPATLQGCVETMNGVLQTDDATAE